ncbi:hypothetical protein [Halioxenophilus sp. WMMB6]|uniref:hypothetical protein n=1 Tax=Halioxenophilus sp. WMMB6 TaxID=3073815 RepID=UPI00295E5C71|nr:hypothetical protein [Halioxenophilus sp. WMMB6]
MPLQKRKIEAEALTRKIAKIDDSSPSLWSGLGENAKARDNLEKAIANNYDSDNKAHYRARLMQLDKETFATVNWRNAR